ncbi:MAG: four helix bundle protein [Pyrinomonadaceae bacterium]
MQFEERPEVWRKAMDVAIEIYKRTASFPAVEIEGLAAQIRQAAMQLPTNIGLAAESDYTSEVLHFLSNARHAAHEIDTLLIIAQDLNHLNETECSMMRENIERIRDMMAAHFKLPDA